MLKELSNFDLDRIFKGSKYYGMTCCKDVLPKLEQKFYIINLADDKDANGTHWTMVFNVRPDVCIYFDSFAQPPPQHVLKRMKQTGKPMFYNDLQIQNLDSIMCGYYVCYIIKELLKGRKFMDILMDFGADTKKNEKEIKAYSNKHNIKAGAGIYDRLKATYDKVAPDFLKPSKRHTRDFQKYLDTHGQDEVVSVKIGQKPVQGAVQKALNIASLGKFNKAREKLGMSDLIHSYLIITTRNKKGELIHKKIERNHKLAAVDPSNDDYKTLYNVPLKNKNMKFSTMFDNAKKGNDNYDLYDARFRNCANFVDDIVNSNELDPSDEVKQKIAPPDGDKLIKSLGPLEPLPKLVTGIANVSEHLKDDIKAKVGLGTRKRRNKKS